MSGTQMVNNDKKRPNQTEHNEALERLRSWLEIPSAERVLTITALELGEEVRLLQICFLAEDLFHGDRQAAENARLKKMYAEERLKAELRQEALEGKL
jgi:hypothetical protein